jgi:hypothetical protein
MKMKSTSLGFKKKKNYRHQMDVLGYIMTMNSTSARTLHAFETVKKYGVETIFFQPLQLKNKVRSNMLAQESIYEKIAELETQYPYVFVFEDDISSHEISKKDVDIELNRTYTQTLQHDLPLFYVGMCGRWRLSPHRYHGRCAHGYAVRPERARYLLNATKRYNSDYMDVRLDNLGIQLGGFFVAFENIRSPQSKDHFGLLYQDRRKFKTTIG